jgi:tRNA (guanine37-N1)-methyltransferase
MRIDVLTLFPEMFTSVLGSSILKRAADPSLYPPANPSSESTVENSGESSVGNSGGSGETSGGSGGAPVGYHLHNIRQFSLDKHDKVDRPPFGGGPGMVIQCQPVWDAVQAVTAADARPATRIVMSPQGQRLTQPLVEQLARQPRLMILCGHYEGFDQRVLDALDPILHISIGDYVLTSGELAAMVLIDSVVRLIPGVLGDDASAEHESFSSGAAGLLDYPHYTRPRVWMDREVPPVLLGGNHAEILKWRLAQARARTETLRPDLLTDSAKKNDDDTSRATD